MTLPQFLLEYTIENVCGGNRSECARRLGLTYDELKHFRRRLYAGASSSRVTEALLEMYRRDDLSMDGALEAYTRLHMRADKEADENSCEDFLRSVQSRLEEQRRAQNGESEMLKSALRFFLDLERAFCEGVCGKCRLRDSACAVRQFADYQQWMMRALQARNAEALLTENTKHKE